MFKAFFQFMELLFWHRLYLAFFRFSEHSPTSQFYYTTFLGFCKLFFVIGTPFLGVGRPLYFSGEIGRFVVGVENIDKGSTINDS